MTSHRIAKINSSDPGPPCNPDWDDRWRFELGGDHRKNSRAIDVRNAVPNSFVDGEVKPLVVERCDFPGRRADRGDKHDLLEIMSAGCHPQ